MAFKALFGSVVLYGVLRHRPWLPCNSASQPALPWFSTRLGPADWSLPMRMANGASLHHSPAAIRSAIIVLRKSLKNQGSLSITSTFEAVALPAL